MFNLGNGNYYNLDLYIDADIFVTTMTWSAVRCIFIKNSPWSSWSLWVYEAGETSIIFQTNFSTSLPWASSKFAHSKGLKLCPSSWPTFHLFKVCSSGGEEWAKTYHNLAKTYMLQYYHPHLSVLAFSLSGKSPFGQNAGVQTSNNQPQKNWWREKVTEMEIQDNLDWVLDLPKWKFMFFPYFSPFQDLFPES